MSTHIRYHAGLIEEVSVPMDGTKEPDLRRKKIIHRVIERIDRRIEILIAVRNRLVELEQRDQ